MSKSKKDWAAERGFDAGASAEAPSQDKKPTPQRRARTGIGAIYEQAGSTLSSRVEALTEEVNAIKGELDPSKCRRSRFYNRLDNAYDPANPAFAELMESIATTKGNVQLGMVRPCNDDSEYKFEIVYGHRRHAACKELGLNFRAWIADVDDQTAVMFQQMENEGQLPPSPYERGLALQDIKNKGLYTSMSELSTASGQSKTNVFRFLALAELPDDVIAAFGDPTVIPANWAEPLTQALADDRKGVLERAKAIAKNHDKMSARKVYLQLIGKETKSGRKGDTKVKVGKRTVARLTTRAGKPALLFNEALPKKSLDSLREYVAELFKEQES
jgi:ParB family chromosome partitioning protein